jgi:hypothetical protein
VLNSPANLVDPLGLDPGTEWAGLNIAPSSEWYFPVGWDPQSGFSLAAESSSGQLVEKEVESGDAAVAGDEEISSGVRRRRAGPASYPFDAAPIAQFLGLGNGLILKVGVSRLDRASDAVDFVAASKGALTRVVEHAILVPELVEGGAAARWVIFAKYVAQIPK